MKPDMQIVIYEQFHGLFLVKLIIKSFAVGKYTGGSNPARADRLGLTEMSALLKDFSDVSG
jgi:hypothetical protein